MAELHIRVLGPLVVSSGDSLLRPPAGRARIVLAVLALHHGETVSRDRLVEAAWAGRAPATATTQLQGMVSALRRMLPAGTIETDGSGYRLRAAAARIDLAQAQDAFDRAREALRADRPVDAFAQFRAGLDAWRGTAFEGLDSAYLAGHATRLAELRNAMVQQWASTALDLGRGAAAVEELTDLLDTDALREPVCSLLMLALYQSGRQADALAVFRRIRAALREALGIEPGPDLQRLHQRVLAADPGLLPVPASEVDGPQRTEQIVPADVPLAQLPPDAADFTGREHQVKRLCDLLIGPAAEDGTGTGAVAGLALISGIGGVGKTTLAVHVAHQLRSRFPDGQVYVNLHAGSAQPLNPWQVAGRVLRDLGFAPDAVPADGDEREALYRSALADRQLLLVLDDARDAAQVRPLLPASPGSAVLVTSRQRMPGLTAARVDLDVLDEHEAADLFARIVGSERSAAEPVAVAEVLSTCGYLPLAVRLAASRLAARPSWPVRVLADRLAQPAHRLAALTAEDQQARSTFQVSYQALPPAQARAFRLLAVADLDEVPVGAAAALLDLDQRAAEELTEALVDVNLLAPTGPGRYRYHDLLRLFAREQAHAGGTPSDRSAALGRLLAWYHDRTAAATDAARPGFLDSTAVSEPFPDAAHARAWLEQEFRNLTLTLTQCAALAGTGPLVPDVRQLARTLHHIQWYLRARGHWQDWAQIAEALLDAAVRTGDPEAELTARNNLGQLANFRGDWDRAGQQLHRALDLARTIGDRSAEAYTLNRLGLLAFVQDRWLDGIEQHRRALAIFTELDDRQGRCTVLINIGKCHRGLHELRQALDVLDAAGALARELADPHSQTMVLHHVACCYTELGNLDEAVAAHEECLALTRQLGQREGEAYTLAELGGTHLAAHRPALAVSYLRQAVDLFHQIGDANATAVFQVDLGHAHQQAGQPDRATAAWAGALRYFESRDPAMTDTIRRAMSTAPSRTV